MVIYLFSGLIFPHLNCCETLCHSYCERVRNSETAYFVWYSVERIPEIVFPIFFNLHNSPCEETVNRGLVITLDVGRLVCDQVTLIRPPRSVSFSAFVFWDLSTFIFFFKRLIRASFFFCFVMLYLTFFIKSKSGGQAPLLFTPSELSHG